LAGSIGEGAEACLEHGVTSYFGICSRPMTLEEAMGDAAPLLADVAFRVVEFFRSVRH
jgi:glycerate kinase